MPVHDVVHGGSGDDIADENAGSVSSGFRQLRAPPYRESAFRDGSREVPTPSFSKLWELLAENRVSLVPWGLGRPEIDLGGLLCQNPPDAGCTGLYTQMRMIKYVVAFFVRYPSRQIALICSIDPRNAGHASVLSRLSF